MFIFFNSIMKNTRCRHCKKTFKRAYTLKVHMRTQHSKIVTKLICPRCRQACSDMTNLRVHHHRYHANTVLRESSIKTVKIDKDELMNGRFYGTIGSSESSETENEPSESEDDPDDVVPLAQLFPRRVDHLAAMWQPRVHLEQMEIDDDVELNEPTEVEQPMSAELTPDFRSEPNDPTEIEQPMSAESTPNCQSEEDYDLALMYCTTHMSDSHDASSEDQTVGPVEPLEVLVSTCTRPLRETIWCRQTMRQWNAEDGVMNRPPPVNYGDCEYFVIGDEKNRMKLMNFLSFQYMTTGMTMGSNRYLDYQPSSASRARTTCWFG